jgi:hypothetical protein
MGCRDDFDLSEACSSSTLHAHGATRGPAASSHRCYGTTTGHSFLSNAGLILLISVWVTEGRPRSGISSDSRQLGPSGDAGGDTVRWARPRSRDKGVGRFWRKCHGNYVKEVQVGSSRRNFSFQIHMPEATAV